MTNEDVTEPFRGYQRMMDETREQAQLRELERCWKRIDELQAEVERLRAEVKS